MWDSEADKYWKEKEKAKRRADLQKKVGLGVATVFFLALLVKFLLTDTATPAQVVQNKTAVVVEIPRQVLNSCKESCRLKAIDYCNKECRFSHQEMPRPTIFRACQSPCVSIAHKLCDTATHESPQMRKQCKSKSQSLPHSTCKQYENVLPRPRVQQVCSIGGKSGAAHSCENAETCLQDEMRLLKNSQTEL